MHFINRQILLSFFFIGIGFWAAGQSGLVINPGQIWPDDAGRHIQAHGGGIIKVGNTFYWYGEERGKETLADTLHRYVSCYSSVDLIHWKFEGDVLKLSKPDTILKNGWVLERPKVFYNKKTNKYVMYMHLDGRVDSSVKMYAYASVGTAISDKPTGPFTYLRSFRPLGQESRDIGQFIDDDGSAYLIFESRPTQGFFIAQLTDDYLGVEIETAFIKARLEGGAIVHYKDRYYVVGSALTGWDPNPNKVASALSLSGPWSTFTDIAPPDTKTYGSQSTYLLKIEGSKDTTVIYMGDEWHPDALWDSRYLWMPVEIGKGKLWLPEPKPWVIDIKTGTWQLVPLTKEEKNK
jgi:hypothetical protein